MTDRARRTPSQQLRLKACAECGCVLVGDGLCERGCRADASLAKSRAIVTYVYRLDRVVDPRRAKAEGTKDEENE